MLRVSFTFILFIFGITLHAQEYLSGTVVDAGTREPLDQVTIKTTGDTFLTTSDSTGGFKLSLALPGNSVPTPNNQIRLSNNLLSWDEGLAVTISLYALNGTTIYNENFVGDNSTYLPIPAPGHYLLEVKSGSHQTTILLFSNGQSLVQGRKKNMQFLQPVADSILVFSRPGYYPREIPLTTTDTIITVNLLKDDYDNLDYFNELISHEAFLMLHSSPPLSNYGEIQSIKVLYNFEDDEIYYSNTKKYSSHFAFAEAILGYGLGVDNFFYSQYGSHSSRFLNLVTINYHKTIDKYVFEFGSIDLVDCEGVKNTYEKILSTSFFGNKLYFYANNLRWQDCVEIPIITSEELYEGQNFQALNLEESYGYLRKVEIDELANTYLGRHDIVLLNGIPNNLSVVAGIITTEFQTALSHINILSHNRQTPNMALKDGWTNPRLDTLLGHLVYLKVEGNDFEIRTAGIDEAEAFWLQKEPQIPVVLEKDTETSGLIELEDADFYAVATIGGKAANFAELVNLENIPVPENYFAIPFYYYEQHIQEHGINNLIDQMLADEQTYSDLDYRKEKLEGIQDAIEDAQLNQELKTLVMNRIGNFNEFEAIRFRSSTNAEDLENFSGAGLYDSYSAKKDHPTKTIDRAIKKVWASLWNLRAFDEREYYKIDQQSVAMGILVHRSFPDEDANGVVITRNLYNNNHGYTINVQYMEYSITYPEPGIMHDQIIAYTINLEQNNYTFEYLTQSNIPELNGQPVLSDQELYELADYCTEIKQHYFYNLPHNGDEYNLFAVDIEFKVDSKVSPRRIYIKQARIYAQD